MVVANESNRRKRLEKSIKKYEKNNPEMARKLRGKMFGLIGKTPRG